MELCFGMFSMKVGGRYNLVFRFMSLVMGINVIKFSFRENYLAIEYIYVFELARRRDSVWGARSWMIWQGQGEPQAKQ